MQSYRGLLALLGATSILATAVAPTFGAETTTSDARTASPHALPFDAPATAALRASPRKAFAHYLPSLPVSLFNEPPESDYYVRHYLNPDGLDGRHRAYGGFMRDRPLPRPVRDGDWELADAQDEVRQAISAGIDGFAVDLLVASCTTNTRVLEAAEVLLRAAETVDPGFKVMLVPDMNGGLRALDVAPFADYVAYLAASPAAYRLADGRLVLAPFNAEVRAVEWWQDLLTQLRTAHGIDAALLPVFLGEQPHVSSFAPISYGISNWGERSPAGNDPDTTHATSPRGRAAAVHAAGAAWMQPVSVQDERPREGRFWEAQNTTNLRNTWKIAIESGAELVQLVTWNDYAESSQFAPSSHQGWSYLDISAYYLAWWKTGRAPAVVRDTVYLTHRKHAVAATPTFPQTKLMKLSGGSPARDTVEALTFLTAPATVTVRVGSSAYTCQAQAGVDVCTVPLGLGEVSASVARAGTATAAVTSPYVVTSAPFVQDLHYGATTSSPVQVADVAAPTAPETLTATAGSTTVALSWAAATDDVGVNHYEVHRSKLADFAPTAATRRVLRTDTSYTDSPPAASWYYKVLAVDAAGKLSPTSPQATAQVVGAPTVVTLTPTADAFANQAAATTNNGSGTSMLSRGGTTQAASSYLRFVLPAAPTNQELTQAVLKVQTTTDTTSGSIDAHSVKVASDSWGETSLNWSNRPAVTGATLGSITGAKAVNTAYQATLDAVALLPLVGKQGTIAIQGSAGDNLSFWSRNHPTAASRPQLVLTFRQLTSDTDGPTQPADVSASVSDTTIGLSWTASVDDTAVGGYEVHRSSSAVFTPSVATKRATVNTTSYDDAPGVGTWYYRIVAEDTHGQPSLPSDPTSATIPDTTPPSAPGVPSGSVTAGDVSLSWAGSTDDVGVNGYRVYRGGSAGFTVDGGSLLGPAAAASYLDADRPAGSWFYRIVAHDLAGNDSAASEAGSVTVPDLTSPSAASGLAAVVSGQQVELSWTAGSDDVGVTGYEVHRSDTAGFAPSAATKVDTVAGTSATDNPSAGTWSYVVVATDAAGNSGAPSNEVSAAVVAADGVVPSQPGRPVASVAGQTVSLSWAGSTDDVGVSGYDLYRSATEGFTPGAGTLVATVSGASTSDTPGVGTWHYAVVAQDAAGNGSTPSDEASAEVQAPDSTPPDAPGDLTADVTDGAVTLTWTEATDDVGVTGYDVHRSGTAGFAPSAATKVDTVAGTSATDNPGAGTWHYAVVATDAAGNSGAPSNEVSAAVADVTAPSAPGVPSGSVTAGDVSLSWGGSTDDVGVNGYRVYRGGSAGFTVDGGSLLGPAAAASYLDADRPAGSWFYRIVAHDLAGNDSAASEAGSVTVPDLTSPSAASGLAAVVSGQQVELSWTAGSDDVGVTGYEVHRSDTAGFAPSAATKVDTVAGTSATDNPSAGTWSYVVVATDAAGNSGAPSNEVSAAVVAADGVAPSQPGRPVASVAGQTVSLSWAGSTDDVGVSGYDLYRSATPDLPPGPGTKVLTVTETSATDSPGAGTWCYVVIAKDTSGNGSMRSGQGMATVSASVPLTVPTVSPTADAFANSGAPSTNYGTTASLLSRGTPSATSYLRFTLPATPAGMSLTGAVLKLRTTTDTTSGSGDSHPVRIAGDGWTEAALTWNSKPAVTGALLGTISGATAVNTAFNTVLSPSALTGLLGTQQTFGITSTGSNGLYVWSRNFGTVASRPQLVLSFESVSTDTTPPTVPTGVTSSVSGPTVTLSWTASTDDTGVTGYDVHRSTTPAFTPTPTTKVGTQAGTSYTDAPGVGTWYYRVVARDAGGGTSTPTSISSAVVTDGTAPTTPGQPNVTVAGSAVSLSWAGSTDAFGVTGYELHRAPTTGFTPTAATRITTVTGTSRTDSPGVGTWYYRVIATDSAGNTSTASAQAGATVNPASPPTVITVSPTADSFANSAATTTNYGTSASLLSRGTPGAASYLRFAVPAAPAGKSLTGAVLRVHTTTDATAGSTATHPVKVAGDGWTETGLTWSSKPAISGALLGTISGATAVNTQYATVLTPSAVTALLGSTRTFGITSTGGDSLYVWSRNFGTVASRPQLVLSFG